jgi:molybdate transport system substrate-binding protein
MHRRILLALGLGLSMSVLAHAAVAQDREITVFAAASLQNALQAVALKYREQTGRSVRFSFAASSNLARQIEQGAPAAIFASADEQWMDYLQQRKLIVDDTRKSLLGNRLVLVVPAANPIQVDLKPGFDLTVLLGADGRWVTGDPASVPVGRYAEEALKSLGAWDQARTRLVRAENVRVALAFVERREVAAGVVYETDAAVSKNVRIAGVFPADSHKPVSYPVAVIGKHDAPTARGFLKFMASDAAGEIWRSFGFSVR